MLRRTRSKKPVSYESSLTRRLTSIIGLPEIVEYRSEIIEARDKILELQAIVKNPRNITITLERYEDLLVKELTLEKLILRVKDIARRKKCQG